MDTDSIEIGDVFEDNDSRMMRCPISGPVHPISNPAHRRRVKVIGFIPHTSCGGASRYIVEDISTGLRTKIMSHRLRTGGKRGFTRVDDRSAKYDAL